MFRSASRLSVRRLHATASHKLFAIRSSVQLYGPTRHVFGGGFFTKNDSLAAAAVEIDPKQALLNVNVHDLANGDDMPPMLQYNETLVDSALELLERTNRNEDLSADEQNAVASVVAMLFAEHLISPWEQYCAVAQLADLPECRASEATLKCIRDIYSTILPNALAQMVYAVDSLPELREATPEARQRVHRLVQVVIDNGGGEAASADEVDKALVEALQGVEANFPALFNHSNFVYLLQDINRVCLQARFAYLINETCLAFDPERTGRIVVKELKESLEKIMPPHAVERIMQGVEADTDGKIYYPQLALLLMRGEGPVVPQEAPPAPLTPAS